MARPVARRAPQADSSFVRDAAATIAACGAEEADIPIEVEEDEELREDYIAIRDVGGERVITVIEILSPGNKSPGSKLHQAYLEKQQTIMLCDTQLVEIDLLRNGARAVAPSDSCLDRVRPFDCLVSVRRSHRPGVFELYPRTIRQRLPKVRIPLKPDDPDVLLDLQGVFERCYDGSPYQRLIDYSLEPKVPLSPEDSLWADELLRQKGLREDNSEPCPASRA